MATLNGQQQKITSCLWFDGNGEQAVDFYTSVFEDAKKGKVTHYGKDMPMPEGSVMTVMFEIGGQKFLALNGGPDFKFTEAVSFMVNCETQEEIDYYWEELAKGGEHNVCGWLKDKFGLSWQVVPRVIEEMMTNGSQEQTSKVMLALVKMKKLDIKTLENAYREVSVAE